MKRTFWIVLLSAASMLSALAQDVTAVPAPAPAAEGASNITVGAELIVSAEGPGKNIRGTPRVACGKDNYLCVWREGWEGKNGGARIRAARLSPDGKLLDALPLELAPNKDKDAPQEQPRVAFCQDTYLVVWQDFRNGTDYDVLAARISADGKVLDAEPLKIAVGPHNQAFPDVAADTDGFLIVWQGFQEADRKYHGYAVRVDSKGSVSAENFDTGIAPNPQVSCNGKSFLVVRACVHATTSAAQYRLLEASGKPVGPCAKLLSRMHQTIAMIPDKGWLIVSDRVYPDPWGWGGRGTMFAVLIANNGSLDPTSPKEEQYPKESKLYDGWLDLDSKGFWPYGQSASAWDGKHTVVVWARHHNVAACLSNPDLYAMQMDGWKRVSDTATTVANSEADEQNPSLACNGAGQLLCVYEKEAQGKTIICVRALTSK